MTHERKREAGWQPCIKCRKVKAAALLLCLMLTFMAVTVSANTEACVIYEGSAKRFLWISDSEYGENDLFGGFKGVMPGDRLTQEIKVSNARENGVKAILYLRAEPVDEAYRDFLSQLTLTVWTEEQTILAQGPADQSTELSERICLGTFYAGAETTLKISLEVPESLDNSYQNALGRIRWVFTAEENPVEPTGPNVPQTSDGSGMPAWFLLFIGSAFTAVWLAADGKRRSRNG